MDSWRLSLTISWAATFVALLADEISEHVVAGSWPYISSLVVFGISVAVALISGCVAAAALMSSRKNTAS